MTTTITPDSNFEISSGAVAFGCRQEVLTGSQHEMQAPSCPDFGTGGTGSGTVLTHACWYNLRALSGRWNVCYLVETTGSGAQRRTAAFCAHESVEDPHEEAQRIVAVANAPWEKDNGTNKNTSKTWEGRVIVINRYDWMEGYYEEQEDNIEWGEEDLVAGGDQCNSRWLADYQHVKDNPQDFNSWCTSGKGTRLVILGEYIYGRWGLVPDRSAVHSFLFFTGDTQLAKTTFQGDNQHPRRPPVYVPLTPEQRHAKSLVDGSYLGLEWLKTEMGRTEFPGQDHLVGPFGVDHLTAVEAIETLLCEVQPHVPRLEPQLLPEILTLLNESLAFWVYCLGRLAQDATTREDFMKEAFANSFEYNCNNLHSTLRRAIEESQNANDDTTTSTTRTAVSTDALYRVVSSDSKLWQFLSPQQVASGIHCLLKEILELAGNCAQDNERTVVVPLDIRSSIVYDQELCDECLHSSKVFWPPDMV